MIKKIEIYLIVKSNFLLLLVNKTKLSSEISTEITELLLVPAFKQPILPPTKLLLTVSITPVTVESSVLPPT